MADSVTIWSAEECRIYLPTPKPSDNKYRRGVLTCITGSNSYPGAALLTTDAALSTGLGMVRYLGPRMVRNAVIQNRPEIVVKAGKCDAYLIGSGIPKQISIFTRFRIFKALREHKPLVIDAEALKFIKSTGKLTVITPHIGELSKLISVSAELISQNPVEYATYTAQKFNVTVLLKGHETIVANKNRVIKLPPATSWLATAGTGDVLAGILGGLVALNHQIVTDENLIEISATASLIHAKCAIDEPLHLNEMISRIPQVVVGLSA